MKKVMFGLCTLMMCFFIAACGGNNGGKEENDEKEVKELKELIKELENAKDWDVAKFEKFYFELVDNNIEFLKTSPTAEELDVFNDQIDELEEAFDNLSEKDKETKMEAIEKLNKNDKFQKKAIKMHELLEKANNKAYGPADWDSADLEPVKEMSDSLAKDYYDYDYEEYPDSLSY